MNGSPTTTNDELIEILADGLLCGPNRCLGYAPSACKCALAAERLKEALDKLDRAEVEIERLRNERERVERALIEMRIGNATPCERCHGLGVRAYGSTTTWRGGAGGQAITSDVCDRCWGSGTTDRPWPSHRNLSREEAEPK